MRLVFPSVVLLSLLASTTEGFLIPTHQHGRRHDNNPVDFTKAQIVVTESKIENKIIPTLGGGSSSSSRTQLDATLWPLLERATTTTRSLLPPSLSSSSSKKDEIHVSIERTSLNSRRISGEIQIPCSMEDIWSILTDYDNLSTHVPNLVESRRIPINVSSSSSLLLSTQDKEGGGGRRTCRLYQKGAQNIIGFDFGASVTMDMTESILNNDNNYVEEEEECYRRRIEFQCVESPFFSEFDGEWYLESSGSGGTLVRYTVDVRPKGPVPVAALEWRIREDVPSNLNAIQNASIQMEFKRKRNEQQQQQQQQQQQKQVLQDQQVVVMSNKDEKSLPIMALRAVRSGKRRLDVVAQQLGGRNLVDRVVSVAETQVVSKTKRVMDWMDDETMGTYLKPQQP